MFKIMMLKTMVTLILFSVTTLASQEAKEQFEKAWRNASYTQIHLDDVDINAILRDHYIASESLQLTRSQVWENERLKAWDPKNIFPMWFGKQNLGGEKMFDNGDEHFTRLSQQRQWMTGDFGPVIEEVYLFNQEQKVIFLGVTDTLDEEGRLLHIEAPQPLFHVEHGVAGTENNPLNTWRIVHLTKEKDMTLGKAV